MGNTVLCCSRKVAAKLAQVVTVPEESPVGERRSNGDIECTAEEVEGLIRSVKSDLEHKQKIEIDRRHPIWLGCRRTWRMRSAGTVWDLMVA